MTDSEKNTTKWYKTLGAKLTALAAIISTVVLLYGHFSGFVTWFREDAVSDHNQEYLDSIQNVMAREYVKFEDRKHLPFTLEKLYNERGEVIDSLAFIVQQTTNLVFSNAFAPVQMVLDSHQCRYWLHIDPAGGYWWRDRIVNPNGSKKKTYQYRITYNPTNGSFEYTDVNGIVQHLPHRWERDNNSEHGNPGND